MLAAKHSSWLLRDKSYLISLSRWSSEQAAKKIKRLQDKSIDLLAQQTALQSSVAASIAQVSVSKHANLLCVSTHVAEIH